MIDFNCHAFEKEALLENSLEIFGADTELYRFSTPMEAYFHLYYAIYVDVMRQTGRHHLLTTSLEPLSFSHAFKKIEPLGIHAKTIPLNQNGQVTCEAIQSILSPRTACLSLSWAQGLTGVIHPIEEIASLCKKQGILVHVDATHLFGKHYFRFQDTEIDILTIRFNTFTLLLKKTKTPLSLTSPMTQGDLHEVFKGHQRLDHYCTETPRLLTQWEEAITAALPESVIHFRRAMRLPNCLSIAVPRISGESLAFFLNRKGLQVSVGGGEEQKLAQVLIRSGVAPDLAHASISIALGFETQEEDIEHSIAIMSNVAKKLRNYAEAL